MRLWTVVDMYGSRTKLWLGGDRTGLAEEMVFVVWATGSVGRDVVIEEQLRPARRRRVLKPWPTKPVVRDGVLRTRARVEPGRQVKTGYVVEYLF
jgi:hypothetical protein